VGARRRFCDLRAGRGGLDRWVSGARAVRAGPGVMRVCSAPPLPRSEQRFRGVRGPRLPFMIRVPMSKSKDCARSRVS
jgi:hypothetical protein